MIVVHMPRTYPDVLRKVRSSAQRREVLELLAYRTLGDWSRVADSAIADYGDVVVGAYKGRAISAFDIEGSERNEKGEVRFSGSPSKAWAWLIGSPVPGGLWRRGQARPVRYIDSQDVFPEDGNLAAVAGPTLDPEDRMWEVAEHQEWKSRQVTPSTSLPLVEQVEVTLNSRGGVNVTVPAGTRVTVIPRQD